MLHQKIFCILCCFAVVILNFERLTPPVIAEELRLAVFETDATPEVGSPLAYDPMQRVADRLSCRGVVLLPDQAAPVVLCAVDWIGIANESNLAFRQSLAEGAKTTIDRVVVHTLHQHDAPRCDMSAAKLLKPLGLDSAFYDTPFIESVIQRAGQAVQRAMADAQLVTEIRVGSAIVQDVASNRRMLSPDGVVQVTRYTACKDPSIRALPVGVIDPKLKLVTFEGASGPLAALTFYATHPQSYYRVGAATPDFPGLARNARQEETGVFHVHFNGAGGNIGAGKYNDGSHENRAVLAGKVADGMRAAWEERQEILMDVLDWQVQNVQPPLSEAIDVEQLKLEMNSADTPVASRCHAAEKLAFAERMARGETVPISRLKLGQTQLIFMPGELFVEYQLAAQDMAPESNVLMAAYGDYGTQYIGTRVAYAQGGYETSPRATNVSPAAERVLLDAMQELLGATVSGIHASDYTDRTGPSWGQ